MATEQHAGDSASLLELIEERSQQPVHRCFQCDKCATGCPMLENMDVSTNQLFQLMQLGEDEEVLTANTSWLCASCYTCSVRCPNEIDIAQVMDVVRSIAHERGHDAPLSDFVRFHEQFLDAIRRRGRINEVSLMMRLHANPFELLSQSKLGLAMFRRGRLKWPTEGIRARKEMQAIFDRMDEQEAKHDL